MPPKKYAKYLKKAQTKNSNKVLGYTIPSHPECDALLADTVAPVIANKKTTWLIIVESPSKCKKIEDFLGADSYRCIASRGHFCHIPSLKHIVVKKKPKPSIDILFEIMKEKEKYVSSMREIIAKYNHENIMIATDDDREGEAIAQHICDTFGLPSATTKRILFHEITEPAVKYAVEHPTLINRALVSAQRARQVLDLIVGHKISPMLWKYLPIGGGDGVNRIGLSAGRCQTPALHMIYAHHQERERTTGADDTAMKYQIQGYFLKSNFVFLLNHVFHDKIEVNAFLEKSIAFRHTLKIHAEQERIRTPPSPFNTSLLLRFASSYLHFSPKQTMMYAQLLYQNGYITYMRTDSRKYATSFVAQHIVPFIVSSYGENFLGTEYTTTTIATTATPPTGTGTLQPPTPATNTSAHEAIRITHIEYKTLTEEQLEEIAKNCSEYDKKRISKLYHFIWVNTIQSCMADAVIHHIPIWIRAPLDYHYTYIVEKRIFDGFLRVPHQEPQIQLPSNNANNRAQHKRANTDEGDDADDEDTITTTNKRDIEKHNECDQHDYDCDDPLQQPPPNNENILFYIQCLNEESKKDVAWSKIQTKCMPSISFKPHYTEASLIQLLEKTGIGRPSTFATIVDTLLYKHYVEKKDVVGKTIKCAEYYIEMPPEHTNAIRGGGIGANSDWPEHTNATRGGGGGGVAIKRTEIEKTFGNEKNKLVLTHTGKYVVEFLYHYYPHLFSYEYTREMEEKLDIIATVPETSWWPVCIDCIDEIKTNSKVVFSVAKEILTIDASNQLFFSKCGPVVYQKQPNGETIMCSIRNDVYIDIEKIHTYTPDMLLDVPRPFLGIVEGGYVFIKNGIYGAYIEWTWGKDGERNKNIPLKEYFAHHKDKTMGDLLLEDVMPLLMGETQNKSQHKGIVRDFGGGINIRKGDKGLYVFVKKENVRKPLFISLKKCPLDVETGTDEEWLAWIGTH